MEYEKVFEKPYSTGWKDLPDRTTPVTAAIMDDYDEAIEHIENHLEGTPAIFPIQATGGMTQPVGIDENGRLVTMPTGGGGGGSASEITYDNTESELEFTDVQGAIDELAAGAGEKVTPVPKTEDMTQEVGIDEDGELWTAPGSGEGGIVTVVDTIVEDAQISSTSAYMTANLDKNPFECKMLWIILRNATTSTVTNVFPDKIPASGNVALNATGISSSNVTVNITETTIGGVNYSGSFQDLWVDIYGIKEINMPRGSSGLTKLWEAPTTAGISDGTMELSDTYANYDFLIFSSARNNLSRQGVGVIVKEDLDYSLSSGLMITELVVGGYFAFTITDSTHFAISGVSGEAKVYAIYGYKASGGSSDSWTKLLDVREESSQTASSYTLSDDITNYNTIAVSGYFVHSLGNVTHVETLPIDMIEIDSSVHQICIDNSHVVTVKFPTSTSIESVGSAGNTYIYQVYGK